MSAAATNRNIKRLEKFAKNPPKYIKRSKSEAKHADELYFQKIFSKKCTMDKILQNVFNSWRFSMYFLFHTN